MFLSPEQRDDIGRAVDQMLYDDLPEVRFARSLGILRQELIDLDFTSEEAFEIIRDQIQKES